MNAKICPFMGPERSCQYMDCTLWVKTENGGRCAVAVIAEEMRQTSAGLDMVSDNLTEIGNNLPAMVKAVKGLV